jgi:hypothetical protein
MLNKHLNNFLNTSSCIVATIWDGVFCMGIISLVHFQKWIHNLWLENTQSKLKQFWTMIIAPCDNHFQNLMTVLTIRNYKKKHSWKRFSFKIGWEVSKLAKLRCSGSFYFFLWSIWRLVNMSEASILIFQGPGKLIMRQFWR